MSNHEIEDVLSSIRRLVSEDLRPAPKPDQSASDKPAPAAAAPEVAVPPAASAGAKLLLTPSLRVIEDPADVEADSVDTDFADVEGDASQDVDQGQAAFTASDDDIASSDEDAGDDLQDVVNRLGAAVGDSDEDWESPVGDPPAWEEVELSDSQSAGGSHGRLHFRPTDEDSTESAPEFLEDEEAATTFESQSFGSREAADADYAEDLAEAEEEPAVQQRRYVSPPEDDWAAAAEAEVRAELEQDVEDNTASMFEGGEYAFDEEVLRDLVRDIIREELAGTLGERITRNVRKLVRAEIARALAVREFE